jgi:hypothetical protein
MRIVTRLCALAASGIVVLAGCGSPADSTSFKPPGGWKPSMSIGGLMQVWESPDEKQTVMLMKIPVAMKTEDILSSANVKDAKIEEQREITICGNQKATELSIAGSHTTANASRTRTDDRIDGIVTGAGGSTYFAMYARPLHATADRSAEDAIHSICEKN